MITSRTAWVVLLISTLCACQIITPIEPTATFPTPTSLIYIHSDTDYCVCFQSAATGSTYYIGEAVQGCNVCWVYAATSSGTLQDDADIVVTAYSIMAAREPDSEECVGIMGVPYTLPAPYTVTRPTSIPSSDNSDFQTYITSQLLTSLGAMGCADTGQNTLTSPTSLSETANSTTSLLPAPLASLPGIASSTTSLTLQSSTATNSTISLGGLTDVGLGVRIGVGTSVSFIAVIVICLAAYIWHKRRLRSAAITAAERGITGNKEEKKSASEADNQPYLQQKAELETKERRRRRRHELEGRQKMHELDGGTEIREIPAGTHEDRIAVMRSRQELTGGEHSQELDA